MIDSREALCEHLQTALEIEHSTLPPYLCALYSIVDETNAEARDVLRGVVFQEMLHLALVANIMNAVGGRPTLDTPRLLPPYPTPLPHSDGSILLSLRSFSKEAVDGFLAVERPSPAESAPKGEGYATIGQFYEAVDDALERLSRELGERVLFNGRADRQLTDAVFGGHAGQIVAVTDLASARTALREIVEQGEGLSHDSIFDGAKDMFHPDRDEIGHYFRFEQLLLGRAYARGDTPESGPSGAVVDVDWSAVHSMTVNPRTADFAAGSSAREAMDAFNARYCTMLQALEQTFDGAPDRLGSAIEIMGDLKRQMTALFRTPADERGARPGPAFEWVPVDRREPVSSV